MRRRLWVAVAASSLVVLACGNDGTGPGGSPGARLQLSVSRLDFEAVGDTARASAAVVTTDGDTLSTAVTWSVVDNTVAVVDASGLVTSHANGTTSVVARADALQAGVTVHVLQVATSVVVWPDPLRLVPGDSLRVEAAVLDANDVPIDSIMDFAWASSDPLVATVADDGVVKAIAVGGAEVTATPQGVPENMSGAGAVDVQTLSLALIDAGGQHTCGLTEYGALYCWGHNGNGQLGDGTLESRSEPTRHVGQRFTTLAAGNWHGCGIAEDGATYCWGGNTDGQTTGDGSEVLDPRRVSNDLEFAAVYAGGAHSCGLTASGEAYCWGGNGLGTLGIGVTSTVETSPAPVAGDLTFQSLALGAIHTCGLTVEGVAYCWGYNALGQLGIGSHDEDPHPMAEPVAGGLTFVRLVAGGDNTCGLQDTGVLYCWGSDDWGQIGDGADAPVCSIGVYDHFCADAPAGVVGGVLFQDVAVGDLFVCGVATDDTAYCWGSNADAQFGAGSADGSQHNVPESVADGITFATVTAGLHHVCALASDGRAYCWGMNTSGQVGDGTFDSPRTQPTLVARQEP